jgi:hypothetical protein
MVSLPSVKPAAPAGEHPLLIAAVLVWLSVEAIGDGVMALLQLTGLRTPTAQPRREITPS